MREVFPWARGLSEEAFERALLFAGLLSPSMARRQALPATDDLSGLLIDQWHRLRGRPWAWRLREGTARLIREQGEALRLVEAAQGLLAVSGKDWGWDGRGLRLEVNVPDALDPRALSDALRRAGAHSAYVRRKAEGEMAWSWPLRIGLARTSELLAGVHPDSSLRPLFHEFHYESAPMRANLLLFEASLPEIAETMVRSRRRPLTDAVVVFGGIGDADTSAWEMLSLLSEATGAQGVFVFDALDPGREQDAADGLIRNLSHDLPLDSAAARVAADRGASVLAWATRSLVEATSIREQGRILARRLQQMGGAPIRLDASIVRDLAGSDRALGAPGEGAVAFGPPGGEAPATWVSAQDLGTALEERLQPPAGPSPEIGEPAGPGLLRFDRESRGARTLARLSEAAATEADAEAMRREARYLQARVETGAGRAIQGEAPLRPSREYAACVFIGARDRTWLGLAQPFEAPQPPDGRPLLLDVLFWEPTVSPRPQIARLELRPLGNSGVVRFPFRTAADQSLLSARIAVYHQNRNLQTGLLRGRVGDEPAALTFTLDAAPLPKFVGLADRAGVGASIIVNDDPSGGMQAFIYHDGEAAVTDVSDVEPVLPVDVNVDRAGGLEGLTAALGRAITRIASNPDEYSDLSKEGSRTLLLDLALHGSALLTRLRGHSQMGSHFDRAGRIQIVMAHVGAFFPIEYLYDGEAPEDDAQICSGAQAASDALASGTCCGAYEADPTHTICPLRFWSLSKVIERHAHLAEHTSLSGQFQLRSAPGSVRDRVLDPLRGAVLAASEVADTAVPDTVETLRTDLEAALRTHPVPLAGDWASWAQEVARTRPTLLVLLPHHLQEGGFDQLEIGGDKRKSMQIRQEHVRSPRDPEARPIVLLIGCQTNAAKVDLEGFVPSFQDAGAAIIVSTIASILGRQAGPAAAAIVQELKQREGKPDATFGEVMLAVRRRLLSTGTPMVLGLTSYGDADWRIGSSGGGDG